MFVDIRDVILALFSGGNSISWLSFVLLCFLVFILVSGFLVIIQAALFGLVLCLLAYASSRLVLMILLLVSLNCIGISFCSL